MKRSGQLKRRSPMARGRGVKPVNRERKAERHARNFGAEAEEVRRQACLCHGVGYHKMVARANGHAWLDHMTTCSKTGVVAAHVTARGMGAAKGGRFDIVPLCDAHHREAGEAGTSQRAAFEQRYGLDLRRLADDIALGMPEPLGIRGLARAWTEWESAVGTAIGGTTLDEPSPSLQLDSYETDALFGWVDRRAERVWTEQPEAIGESAVLAVLVTELGLTIDAAGDLLDAATEGRP